MSKNNAQKFSDKRSNDETMISKSQKRRNTETNKAAKGFKKSRADKPKATNDISWYSGNPTLLQDTAQIPYAWSTGLPLLPQNGKGYLPYSIPGVCALTIDLNPLSIGGPADPVNVMARMITSQIRSFNSGAKNYDANDLMIRLLAEGEFLAFLTYATRLFATANMYSGTNRYMPKALLEAQSIDPEDFIMHLNDYKGAMDALIAKARKTIYIPPALPLYQRWTWMYANYYRDSDDPKDQLYFYTPNGYRYFQWGTNEDDFKGQLTYVDWDIWNTGAGLHTWSDVIEALHQMLDPLYEDQDLCTMTGDMIKRWGDSSLAIMDLQFDMVAVPTVDHIVLEQMRNSQTTPIQNRKNGTGGRPVINKNIKQDKDIYYLLGGERYYDITGTEEWVDADLDTYDVALSDIGQAIIDAWTEDYFLDTPLPNPTPNDTMENTRLTLIMDSMQYVDEETVPGSSFLYHTATSGSERIENIILIATVPDEGDPTKIIANRVFSFKSLVPWVYGTEEAFHALYDVGITCYDTNDVMWLLQTAKAFDYIPKWKIVELLGEKNISKATITYEIVDKRLITRVTNYALIPFNMMKKMNDCALQSEFGLVGNI